MARVVGGIGTSHTPSMAHAFDRGLRDDPLWRPLFDGYAPAKEWLARREADVLIVFYNDHGNSFFFDRYPTFALGIAEQYPLADEGWGCRNFPPFAGETSLGWHIARSLVANEFDLTICQELAIDHGILSALPFLTDARWPAPIVPIAVNVIQHPLPTARRCFRLGQALRRAVESYPQDLRVVVIGTGGLSHQLHGRRFGFVNPDWDRNFLELVERDPAALTEYSHDDLMALGGAESVEMIMWLCMRGALSARVGLAHKYYYAPLLTGFGLIALDDQG